jgi:rhamnosyltransferase
MMVDSDVCSEPPMTNRLNVVVAVVPVHEPDGQLSTRLLRIAEQVEHVIVVDDGSRNTNWHRSLVGIDKCIIVTQQNRGIAAAVNAGVATAMSLVDLTEGFVLTVDQDTLLSSDYVSNALLEFRRQMLQGVPVGAICAEQFNDWFVPLRSRLGSKRFTLQAAQSGMLVPVSSIDQFGGFREDLFIDCVDTEFVLRMLRGHHVTVAGRGCRMEHEVGITSRARLFGIPLQWRGRHLRFSYHGPARRYYITRNRVLVYSKFFWEDPGLLLSDTLSELRTTIASLIFGPSRWLQAKAVFFGLLDGARNRSGRISPKTLARLDRIANSSKAQVACRAQCGP